MLTILLSNAYVTKLLRILHVILTKVLQNIMEWINTDKKIIFRKPLLKFSIHINKDSSNHTPRNNSQLSIGGLFIYCAQKDLSPQGKNYNSNTGPTMVRYTPLDFQVEDPYESTQKFWNVCCNTQIQPGQKVSRKFSNTIYITCNQQHICTNSPIPPTTPLVNRLCILPQNLTSVHCCVFLNKSPYVATNFSIQRNFKIICQFQSVAQKNQHWSSPEILGLGNIKSL